MRTGHPRLVDTASLRCLITSLRVIYRYSGIKCESTISQSSTGVNHDSLHRLILVRYGYLEDFLDEPDCLPVTGVLRANANHESAISMHAQK